MKPLDEDAMLERLREKLGPTKKVDERSELERLFGKKDETQEDKLRKKLVKPVLKVDDVIDISIDKLAFGGDGIGRHGNFPIFVPDAVPGDAVKVKIKTAFKDRCNGEVVEFLAKSSNRIKPACPAFGICGGCQIQSLVYTAQIKAKETMVADILKKIGGVDTRVRSVIQSPEPYGYRIRTRLQVAVINQELKFGYYEKRSKKLVPLQHCPLLVPGLNAVLKQLAQILPGPGIAPVPSEIQLQTNGDSESVLIHLKGKKPILYTEDVLAKCRKLSLPVVGVSSDAGSEASQAGQERLKQHVSGASFYTSGNSFIQANRYLLKKMIDQAIMLASPAADDEVLDLYCGSGFFSLPIARFVKSVLGMEGNPTAVNDAIDAAAAESISNASFQCCDDNQFFSDQVLKKRRFSLVIVDPPRSGIEKSVMARLVEMKPAKLLYVSCNPSTLARDLRILNDADFRLRVVQPIDLFPHTYHLENMVFLTHRYTGTQAANQVFMDLR